MARVINSTRDQVLGRRVELATTFAHRLRGLVGKRDWGDRDGLWIEPCLGVHALGLRFPIDLVLVDEGLTVLWTQTLHPWRLGKMHLDAQAALELPAGTIERTGTRRGDQLALERV